MPGVRMRGGLRPSPSHTDTSGRRSHPYARTQQHSAPDQSQHTPSLAALHPPPPVPAAAATSAPRTVTTPQLQPQRARDTTASDTEPSAGAGAAFPPISTWVAADPAAETDTAADSDSDAEGLLVRHLAASLRRPVPWQRHQPPQAQDADNRGPVHTFDGDWYGPVRRNRRLCRLCRRRGAVGAHVLFGALFDAVAREPRLRANVREMTRARRVQRTMLLSSTMASTTTTGSASASGGSSMAAAGGGGSGGADGGGAQQQQRPRIIAPVPRRCAAAWPPVLNAASGAAAAAAQDNDDDDEAAQPLSPSATGARLHRPGPYHSHHLLGGESSDSDSSD